MYTIVRELLLQVLATLFPVLLIQALLMDKIHLRNSFYYQCLIGGLSGAFAVLCMTFPVSVIGGFIFDFRWIPVLIAIFYGGYYAGGVALLMSVAYRLWIGGDAALLALIGNLIFAVLPFALSRSFYEKKRKHRYLTLLGVSAVSFLYILIMLNIYLISRGDLSFLQELKSFVGLAGIIQIVITMLAVYIIENAFEITKLRMEAQKNEQLMVISELAASVAHEVRNPLTVVRGFIQIAKNSVDEKVQGYMTTAINELDRAESIISDYLNLAKPQPERIEVFDLTRLLEQTAVLMTPFANLQGIDLRLETESGLLAKGDQVKFKQVIVNLIKNSVEATPSGGIIDIKAFVSSASVHIHIKDTGEGMTKEQLSQLGNTFYTTKEKGTGIGLMVAFRIIEAMGGELRFQSQEGRGTTALIELSSA